MAYSASGLHRMAGASGVQLNVRDLIIVMDTNTPTTHFCTVLSNTGTVVDVSDGTAVAETDGD